MTLRPPRPSEAALLKFLALQLRILCRKKSVGEKGALVRVRQLRFPRLRPPDEKLAAPISVAVVAHAASIFTCGEDGEAFVWNIFDAFVEVDFIW